MATALTIGVAACSSDDVAAPNATATNITINSGSDGQNAAVGQALSTPVSVRITDQNGTAMANVTVTWAVMSGSGTTANATTTTDASGNATVSWSLGAATGLNTLKASIPNGKFVTINANAVAATAASIQVVSGNNQSLTAGGTSAPLVVKAVNGSGVALPGVVVTWTTTGGSLSTGSTTTGADGTTSATLNVAAGSGARTVTATAGTGVTSTFTVTGN
jgi:adhesin/invasin